VTAGNDDYAHYLSYINRLVAARELQIIIPLGSREFVVVWIDIQQLG